MRLPPVIVARIWSFNGVFAVFGLLCLPLLFSDRTSNYDFDESNYHLPAIRQIRAHWPRLDLTADSLSATAPGYHYALATVSLLTTANRLPLRLVNFAVSLGVLGLLWRAKPSRLAPRLAVLAITPLAASNFFIKSASFVVTDNAALLATTGALTALLLAPLAPRFVLASALTTIGVFIRQTGIWLVAPLAARIFITPGTGRRLLLVLPPLGVLLCLLHSWGGLAPPPWQTATTGLVPAGGAYLLAVYALLGSVYYAAACSLDWKQDLRQRWTFVGGLGGLSVALAGANTFSHQEGRWGGYLWEVAARLPSFGPYSPVFLLLTTLGGALLAMMVRRLSLEAGRAAALTWATAFGAWAGTGLANRLVFHRYYEPVMLVMLICWLLLLQRSRPGDTKMATWPLVLLGGVQTLITLITAYGRTFGFI